MSTNPQDGSRPTVVLVHGAWADGSGWQGVYNLLKDTTASDRPEPDLSLEGDVAATKMIIDAAERTGHPRWPFLWRSGDHRGGQ